MNLDDKLSLYLLRFAQNECGLNDAVSDIKDAIYVEIKRESERDTGKLTVTLDEIVMMRL